MSVSTPILTLVCAWAAVAINAAAANAILAASLMTHLPCAGLRPAVSVAADHWTIAVFQRPERLFRRNGGAQDVIVTRIFGILRLLHLEHVSRVNRAAVGADAALTEQRIVGRHFLHLSDHGLAVGGAFERSDGLQVMRNLSIDAGLTH